MRVASSPEAQELREALTPRQRLRLLAWNGLPLFQVAVAVLLVGGPWFGWSVRLLALIGWVFVVPPLVARLLLSRWSVPSEDVAFGSDDFFRWWAVSNLQGLFNRLPFLEESLRLFPGLYSAWLRLWGARIGRLTYWSPGVVVLDRPFIEIGDHVVCGVGVNLSSHLILHKAPGGLRLHVAPIRIGDGAIVGGYTVVGPGTEIAPHQATNACQALRPFTRFERGRRLRAEPKKEDVSANA